jgi:hypothetical protein
MGSVYNDTFIDEVAKVNIKTKLLAKIAFSHHYFLMPKGHKLNSEESTVSIRKRVRSKYKVEKPKLEVQKRLICTKRFLNCMLGKN